MKEPDVSKRRLVVGGLFGTLGGIAVAVVGFTLLVAPAYFYSNIVMMLLVGGAGILLTIVSAVVNPGPIHHWKRILRRKF